ncbi:SRPBCC family protein [Amycolatopsis saalfeldensis]|uniref:Carbon monoxide dehydrogenase subunit G n=1 Tax=Amycolatopsis saalfeldensis TaxID=394193 RepID=A0A1H8YHP1_9PSEU|nr:SRPBCC family protein [Amycolatopsis saalfeldensis]SEP51583.1 Carbon monoxide dehydrogenase subunit G [Amycolatopsis saalfeldensis]
MRLDHEFTVPASIGEVWQAVIDPERVAPCLPGAALTKVEGDSFTGTVKVKLGPISLLYKGSGEFLEKDEAARKVVIKASGKDARGGGTAAATVTLTLTETEGGTHGAVASDLAVTGRPAQFGRGLISEVSGKILDAFAGNLAKALDTVETEAAGDAAESAAAEVAEKAARGEHPGQPAAEKAARGEHPGQPAAAEAAPEHQDRPANPPSGPKPHLRSVPAGGATGEAEAIDLMEYAGRSVAKRLVPVAVVAAVLIGAIALIRLLRRR